MTSAELTRSLKAEAHRLGFQMAGCCPAISPTGFSALTDWLAAGFAGEMDYLQNRLKAYEHPEHVMHGVQSILMLGINYQTRLPETGAAGTGRIARYAWGTDDYHDLIHSRLKQLKKFAHTLTNDAGEPLVARGVVDTAPLLEREFAQLAGIGWSAKNTMLINTEHGSWFFLAALLIDQPLNYDTPFDRFHCGTCTACLDACPTDAFVTAGQLDATKCISYLTIEHRSPIAHSLRPLMDDWILGCDVCQDVCPWNNKASLSTEVAFEPKPEHNPLPLADLFWLDDDQFRQRFRKTPLWRPRRRGILRNAAIALGNHPDQKNLPALHHGLNDSEPLIRGACAWALGRSANQWQRTTIIQALKERLTTEEDAVVREELNLAINAANGTESSDE